MTRFGFRMFVGASSTALAVTMLNFVPTVGAQSGAPVAVSGTAPGAISSVVVTAMPVMTTAAVDTEASASNLAANVAISGRSFSVGLNLSKVPLADVSDVGVVNLELRLMSAQGDWLSTASVRAVSRSGVSTLAWADPQATSAFVSASQLATVQAGRQATVRADPQAFATSAQAASIGTAGTAASGVKLSTFVAEPRATVCTGVACAPCKWKKLKTVHYPWATIGTTYPVHGSRGNMAISSSEGGTYGQAYSASGKFGSFKQSGSSFTKTSWSFVWDASVHSRSYQKQLVYRKYREACPYEGSNGKVHYHYHYFYVPESETGGTGEVKGISRPNWGHCVKEPPGIWTRDRAGGHSYTYSGGVKMASVIGIDLSVSRGYSSNQKLNYRVVGHGRRLCGNDGSVIVAGKIMER